MERLIDKSIVAVCCLTAFLTLPIDLITVGGFLAALAIAALGEVFPRVWRVLIDIAYLVVSLAWPAYASFVPLITYDCICDENWAIRLSWIAPLIFATRTREMLPLVVVVLFCIVSAAISWRTMSLAAERAHFRVLRDSTHEASFALEARNRDLQEARDLSVQVATMAERGRIAREIHDNVGHLLTRAIMQVEALKVVHADEPKIASDFGTVADTLNEAMETVRASVHDLRDEATDTQSLIKAALDGSAIEQTYLMYDVDNLPADIARCFVAIVREAATNTVRHSNATSIKVQVREYPGLYQLIVQDNGTKVPAKSGMDSGMGLQAMEDRARALGGTLRTGWDNGFRVFASVPRVIEEEDA